MDKVKNLLFDLVCTQPSENSRYHGGGEYSKTVFEHLADVYHGKSINLSVMYDPGIYIDGWILDKIHEKELKTFHISSESSFCNEIDCSQTDIFYAGMSFEYDRSRLPQNTRCITTLHDLRNYEEPTDTLAYLYFDNSAGKLKQVAKSATAGYLRERNLERYRRRISSFDEFVCVSEHTRYMVKAVLPEFGSRAENVFYTPSKHYEPARKPEGFDETGYILLVSTNRWLKNSYRAIMALDMLYDKKVIENKTVLVGGTSTTIKKRIHNTDRFVFMDYLENSELEYVYGNCRLFLYPSLNEGFGMPPLEAMRYNKTCVLSAVCSLPEIYGDSVYYINPYSVEEMAGRIKNALDVPIPDKKIERNYDRILSRQKEDLKRLCEYITLSR